MRIWGPETRQSRQPTTKSVTTKNVTTIFVALFWRVDGSGGNQEVLLSDMSGKVLEKHLLQAGRNRVDVSRLPQGHYLLRGQFESCRFTKK